MSRLPPELLRAIALTAHPETTRAIKRLNRFLENFITDLDLQIAETSWRLGKDHPRECLFWAVRNGFLKIVSMLLSSFPENDSDENPDSKLKTKISSSDKDIALVWAVGIGSPELVSLLLAHKADIYAARNPVAASSILRVCSHQGRVGGIDLKGWAFPLTVAAYTGYISVVSLLLEAGADIDAGDGEALYVAAQEGHDTLVSFLLKAGATIREDMLRAAAEEGHHLVISLLLQAGADVHAMRDSALESAAWNGHDVAVALLLDAGADVHAYRDTALRVAAHGGHSKVVALLLKAGADVRSLSDDALASIRSNGYAGVVDMLLQVWVNT